MELVEEVAAKYVPENILTNVSDASRHAPDPHEIDVSRLQQYMIRTMSNPSSLWLMRKHFALQTASTIFLSYIACLSNRNPNRFHFSLKTGLIFMTELFACKFVLSKYIRLGIQINFHLICRDSL